MSYPGYFALIPYHAQMNTFHLHKYVTIYKCKYYFSSHWLLPRIWIYFIGPRWVMYLLRSELPNYWRRVSLQNLANIFSCSMPLRIFCFWGSSSANHSGNLSPDSKRVVGCIEEAEQYEQQKIWCFEILMEVNILKRQCIRPEGGEGGKRLGKIIPSFSSNWLSMVIYRPPITYWVMQDSAV